MTKFEFCLIPVVVHEIRGQCCPEGAWGELNNADYQTLGQIDKVHITEIKHEKNSWNPKYRILYSASWFHVSIAFIVVRVNGL